MHTLKALAAVALMGLASVAMPITPAQAQDRDGLERWLDIYNQTSYRLCEVYISHIATNNWGPNLLSPYCIYPEEYMRVNPGYQQGYCRMDMKFVFYDGGGDFFEYDFNICEATDYWLSDY